MIYLVIAGQTELHAVERNLPDMTWAGTVADVATMQFNNLNKVHEVGTGRNVTHLILREAMDYRAHNGLDNSHEFAEMIEMHLGTRVARPLFQKAA